VSAPDVGNQLYRLIARTRGSLFRLGESSQLAFSAFDWVLRQLASSEIDELELQIPLGLHPNRQAHYSIRKFPKGELVERYGQLANYELAQNSVVQMVAMVEALLGDLLRAVILRYPRKIGEKKSVPIGKLLQSKSIEEIHSSIADAVLNELAYKSPQEFAKEIEPLLTVDLLQSPAYHRYIEIKATRDIIVHNRGLANDIYVRKAGSHSRAVSGQLLTIDNQYFLECYETCLQFTEWLERELHDVWPSSEYEEYLAQIKAAREQAKLPLLSDDGGEALEEKGAESRSVE
jgi:hypothetical protein